MRSRRSECKPAEPARSEAEPSGLGAEPSGVRAAGRAALTALSALLLAWSLRLETAPLVSIVALVPWLLALRGAGWGAALASGAFLGTACGVLVASWIPDALQSLGSTPAISWVGLVAVCAFVGPPVFVALGAAARASAGRRTPTRVAALAATVFAAEWGLQSAWWGVPWGLLGYGQRGALGVAQLAAVAGVPAISALLVGLNVALTDAVSRRPGAWRSALVLAAAWAALALAGLPWAQALRPSADALESVDLLIVQPDLPRGERWGDDLQRLNLHRVWRHVVAAVARERSAPDAVVLPENLLTTPVDAAPALARALEERVDALGLPVLTGLVLAAEGPDPGLYRGAVVWLEPGRGVTARLDKERAIPLLESGRRFPGDALFARLVGAAAAWQKVEEAEGGATLGGPIPVTPVLCYEALFPTVVARRRTPGSVAILNLADDGWVEGNTATRHLAGIARFRAIEQRLALVRVAHGGLSVVFDPFGRTVEALPLDRTATLRVSLHAMPEPTLGERAGLLALPLAAGAAAGWLAARPPTSWSRSRRPRGSPRP